MTRYSKFNIVYLLQKWMDSVAGQTFLNYAYSWGASIVILGTLFKLTHLPGANLMLFIGMGTEVFVFFISAFDRPFDKTTDGMDLQTHSGGQVSAIGEEDEFDAPTDEETDTDIEGQEGHVAAAVGGMGGGTIIIGGGGGVGTPAAEGAEVAAGGPAIIGGGIIGGGGGVIGGGVIGGGVIGGGTGEGAGTGEEAGVAAQGGEVAAAGAIPTVVGGVQGASTAWVTQQQQVSPELADATEKYVEELKLLTEMLGKVNEQSQRLTRDSEEMENLNRTLTGISKVYEMQLKGASQQIGTIDQINEQSRKLAQQIEQLNQIYARMIEAMTVNMRATPGGTISNLE